MKLECDHGRSVDLGVHHSALICIDYQADFVRPDGMAASRGLPYQRLAARLPAAQAVLMAARAAGLFVVHTRECYRPDLSDLNAFRRINDPIVGSAGPLGRFLVDGERGTATVSELAPVDGEPTVDKPGFNAFCHTALDLMLRTRGITQLLLMGFTTQCCVASTLRGAVDHGYSPVLLKDCGDAFDPADHEATVRMVYSENHNFGWVSDSEHVCRALGVSTPRP